MLERKWVHSLLATSDILEPLESSSVTHVNGTVDRILLKDNRACGVVMDGKELTAKVVFVAGGTLDTTSLLARTGIGGPAPGTHLTYHPVMIAQVILDESLRPTFGETGIPARLQIPPTPNTPWNTMVLRDTSPATPHPDDADVEENSLIEIQIFWPVDNRPSNRMELTEGGITFDVPLSATDRANMLAPRKDTDLIVQSLGRYRRGAEPAWLDLGFAHLMGHVALVTTPIAQLSTRTAGRTA